MAPPSATAGAGGHVKIGKPGTGNEATLGATCSCGVAFVGSACFCANCGARRPLHFRNMPNLAEVQAVVDGMQEGAAKGVFAKVKETLQSAAVNAVVGINENIKAVLSAMPGDEGEKGLDTVNLRRAVKLGEMDFDFSCHVGFHTNEQVICHLLHLAVQLAIFPHKNTQNYSSQAGPAFSSYACAETMAEVQTTEMDTQTPPPPMRQRVGVRIGGGYHLVETVDYYSDDATEVPSTLKSSLGSSSLTSTTPTSPTRHRPTSPSRQKPLLGEVAEETLKSPLAQPPRQQDWEPPPERGSLLHPGNTNTPYGLGARSDGTPSERFRVAAHATDGTPAKAVKQRGQCLEDGVMRQRDGEGMQLSRYLKAAVRKEDAAAQRESCRSRTASSPPGSSQRGARPRSASSGRVAAIRQLREEAVKPQQVAVP